MADTVYIEWDGIVSLDNRYFHACPVCGIGVCSPFNGSIMAHRDCLQKLAEENVTPA